jgi:hypothetical protein
MKAYRKMGKSFLYKSLSIPLTIVFLSIISLPQKSTAVERKFLLGIKAGVNKLEGDWKKPNLNPTGSIIVGYAVNPFVCLGGEIGYSIFKSENSPDILEYVQIPARDLAVKSTPCLLSCRINFFPLSRFNPFTTLGAGVLYWKATGKNGTLTHSGELQKRSGFVAAAGGGLEMRFSGGLGLTLGAEYDYSSTDLLDQIDHGDENDGFISIQGGLNYYFGAASSDDFDNDGIPADLDLDPVVAEDRNGFMDHDGVPEKGMQNQMSKKAPIVIHHPVFQTESYKDLQLNAKIITSVPLRTAAVLFRTMSRDNWNVVQLQQKQSNLYTAKINGDNITPMGLEYCIVAVDQRVKGIGYSGLPTRPIRVNVIKNGTGWRIAGGLVSALSWVAASYVVFRKQSN